MRENLSIRIYPDPVLRQICDPVNDFGSSLQDLFEEMRTLMESREGIGLAGPQVGMPKRLFVAKLEQGVVYVANPAIKDISGTSSLVEGCLSLPYTRAKVTRGAAVAISGFDANGDRVTLNVEGLWAHVLQHEIDHLDGVLISDHGEPVPAGRIEDERP